MHSEICWFLLLTKFVVVACSWLFVTASVYKKKLSTNIMLYRPETTWWFNWIFFILCVHKSVYYRVEHSLPLKSHANKYVSMFLRLFLVNVSPQKKSLWKYTPTILYILCDVYLFFLSLCKTKSLCSTIYNTYSK